MRMFLGLACLVATIVCLSACGAGGASLLGTPGGPVAGTPLSIATPGPNLVSGTESAAYSTSITAMGGTSAGFVWSIASGALPPGITKVDGTPAVTLSGAPTLAGTYNFTLQVMDNAAATAQKQFTIQVLAAGSVGASISSPSTMEGNTGTTMLQFTVSLSTTSGQNISVAYTTADGTTSVGTDYTLTAGTLIINAGQTSGTIDVPVAGDTTVESDETLTVTLSSPSNATITNSVGTGTILNDDVVQAGPVSVTINDPSVLEGNAGTTTLAFTVSISGTSATDVTMSYTTTDGTATTANSDYVLATGTATIAVGLTTAQIVVTINGDTTDEGASEAFTVNLSNPSSNATIVDGAGTGTITDDDGAGSGVQIDTTALTVASRGQVGYSCKLEASGGTGPYTWAITSGTLPNNLSLSSGGVISGDVDSAAASATVTFQATDSLGATATKTLTLRVFSLLDKKLLAIV